MVKAKQVFVGKVVPVKIHRKDCETNVGRVWVLSISLTAVRRMSLFLSAQAFRSIAPPL
jgi:hypothetical protein